MHFKSLVDALRRHTDIGGFSVEVFLEPKETKTYAQIGMPKVMVPSMETFVREYRIQGAEWTEMGMSELGHWYRLRFPITLSL